MKTSTGGTPTAYYFYDQGGQLMYAFDPATATGTNYMYLGTKLIAKHAMQQLAMPAGVTVNPNPNNGNFTVSWTAVPDATSYTMQTTNGTGTTSVVYSGSATSTAQTVTTGGVQFYQLQACNSSGCSAEWPFSVSVWPAIPTISFLGVTPGVPDNGGYTVTWNAPAGANAMTCSYPRMAAIRGRRLPPVPPSLHSRSRGTFRVLTSIGSSRTTEPCQVRQDGRHRRRSRSIPITA